MPVMFLKQQQTKYDQQYNTRSIQCVKDVIASDVVHTTKYDLEAPTLYMYRFIM